MTAERLLLKTWRSMSEPLRTWPVSTLPISRGRKADSSRIMRRAARRISRRCWSRLGALVELGEGLDLVADLGVGGEVAGAVLVIHPELAGRLALGGEVFLLVPVVHQARREQRDLPCGFVHQTCPVLAAVTKPGGDRPVCGGGL